MTHTQYIQAFIEHNIQVFIIKVYTAYLISLDKLKELKFVLTGKGDKFEYHRQAMVKRIENGTSVLVSTGRTSVNDVMFAEKLAMRACIRGMNVCFLGGYFSREFYASFSLSARHLTCARMYGEVKTGKDFLEFLAFVTDASLRTIEYKLGEELYTRVYSDTPVEELYNTFDAVA